MKTKELIRRLQEEDPSGELECCIYNADIHFVSKDPAYWDGVLEVLIRDETSPYYNVIGAKRVSNGEKITIHYHTIESAIFENPDLPIDYSEDYRADEHRNRDEKSRNSAKDIKLQVEISLFLNWVKNKIKEVNNDILQPARKFYMENLSPNDPLILMEPETSLYGGLVYPSAAQRRFKEWDERVNIEWSGSHWEFSMRNK